MNFLDLYKNTRGSLDQRTIDEVLEINQQTSQYGLAITPREAGELLQVRNRAIRHHGRVEMNGLEVMKKVVIAFSPSPYISQADYSVTLAELIEAFYYLKTETEDMAGDDQLILMMTDMFNNSCRGSLELLLAALAEYLRDFRENLLNINPLSREYKDESY